MLKDELSNIFYTFLGHLSIKSVINLKYRRRIGRPMCWDSPQDLNEKIHWLQLYSDTSAWTDLADKYRVREYVSKLGMGEHLIPLIGRWERVKDIPWDSLPNQFVMKVNNGSGDVIICKDKTALNIHATKKHFEHCLRHSFGWATGEQHYTRIRPCIIAEQLLDASQQSIPSTSLIDYKIWCFHGKPFAIVLFRNRTKKGVDISIYDTQWNLHPEWGKGSNYYHYETTPLPRPQALEQMLQMARSLSGDFPEVRVDLYEVNKKIYFGELTFTEAAGFIVDYSDEFLKLLGQQIIL